jgi:hypothetical protein
MYVTGVRYDFNGVRVARTLERQVALGPGS